MCLIMLALMTLPTGCLKKPKANSVVPLFGIKRLFYSGSGNFGSYSFCSKPHKLSLRIEITYAIAYVFECASTNNFSLVKINNGVRRAHC